MSEERMVCRLKDVLEVVKHPIDMRDEEDYMLASIRRRNGGMFDRETKKGKSILTKTLNKVIPGSFVISRMQVVHGACSMAPLDFGNRCISASYTSLIPREPQRIDIGYLDAYATSRQSYDAFLRASHGVHIEKMTFNLDEWLNGEIELPPLPEQKKIAEILAGIDSTIRAVESKLQKLITTRSKVSEGLLAKSNAEVTKIPLCDCIELVRGHAFKSEDYKEQGGIRILRVTNIREDGKIDLANNCVRISEDLADNYNRFQVRENDLLLVMVGATTGKLGVVSKAEVPSLLNQNIWCLRTSSPRRIVQEYLHCSMPKVVSRHLEKQQGSARDFLTQREFFKEEIEVPNLRIQSEIVKAMGQIDKCINATKSFRERLLLLKSGLSSDLLSGRKKVSV